MPTPYADDVADGQGLSIFLKLLLRWKGSLYKLLWKDLTFYIFLFFGLHLIYRFALDGDQKRDFEEVIKYCDKVKTTIPLSFLLGFFVAGVVGRWWQMFMGIPWLNRVTFMSDGIIIGRTPSEASNIKMSLMRYLILSWILLMRKISKQIEERFSNENQKNDSSVRAMLLNLNRDKKIQSTFRKIITDSEIRAFESIAAQNFARTETKYIPEYWIPLQWASRLLQKAFMNGYIVDIRTTLKLIDELDRLRGQMQNLRLLCSIMIPLVYTQVVIIAVYSYFLCQLFASQFQLPRNLTDINGSNGTKQTIYMVIGRNVDIALYPLFTVFQFLFLMGWLKVAICLLNPFGNGEEDFQTSEILDLNIDVCWRSACSLEDNFPDLLSAPLFNFKVTAPSNDTLNKFVSSTEDDLSEMEIALEQNMASFEWREGAGKLRDFFCCESNSESNWDLNTDTRSIPDNLVYQYTSQNLFQKSIEKFRHQIWSGQLPPVKEESLFPSMPEINIKNFEKENQRKHSNSSLY